MGTDAENLTGIWQGRYSYSFGQSVSFVATLIDSGGSVSGSIHEPSSFGSGTVFALLEGSRAGQAVAFVKRYQNAGPAYSAAVKYRGTLNLDATEIGGRWSIWTILSGPFVMTRSAGKTAEVEHKQSELV